MTTRTLIRIIAATIIATASVLINHACSGSSSNTATNPTSTGSVTNTGTGTGTGTSTATGTSTMTGPTQTGALLFPRTGTLYGITLVVGFAENVDSSTFDAQVDAFRATSAVLWQHTEGQVYIGKLEIWDNADPTGNSSDWVIFDGSKYDIGLWPEAKYNSVGTANVSYVTGRCGRFMTARVGVGGWVLRHELGHQIFVLNWAWAPGLADEYTGSTCNCLMALKDVPLCNATTHTNPYVNPSCWEQILQDYTNFTYSGTNSTSEPTPQMTVVIHDTP